MRRDALVSKRDGAKEWLILIRPNLHGQKEQEGFMDKLDRPDSKPRRYDAERQGGRRLGRPRRFTCQTQGSILKVRTEYQTTNSASINTF